jgi:hypothetical protein
MFEIWMEAGAASRFGFGSAALHEVLPAPDIIFHTAQTGSLLLSLLLYFICDDRKLSKTYIFSRFSKNINSISAQNRTQVLQNITYLTQKQNLQKLRNIFITTFL